MLPKNLKYGSKTESSMARSYTANIQPQGSTSGYLKGTVCTINIPTRTNLCLVASESVLKFTVTPIGTVATQGRLDSCGAHGFIQRIRVFHGSNLLEDTDNYGLLAKSVYDLQVSGDSNAGKLSILAGTRSDKIYNNGYVAPAAILNTALLGPAIDYANLINAALVATLKKVSTVNSGEMVTTVVPRTYCLSLISILGTLSSANYFPLFGCTSAPIRLEIQFVDSPAKAMCCPTAVTDFQIDTIEYIGSYIELSDTAQKIVIGSLTNALQFSAPSFRNYQYTYNLANNSATQVNFPIPAKYVSLKSLIVSMRNVGAGVGVNAYFPLSSNTFGLTSYYFRIGSQTVPAIAPSTTTQFFSEVCKTLGSISDLNHQPSIDIDSYAIATPTVNTAANITNGDIQSGSFFIGLDLENYQGSDKSQVYSGYNTSTDDIYCVMNFYNNSGAAVNCRFDAFAMYDQEVCFESNTCYVKF